jgi:hypothetical protein
MYTVDNALVYDLFPDTLGVEFRNPYEGEPDKVNRYVLVTDDDRYIFVEGSPKPDMEYYGRALVGNGQGDYGEFNAYQQGQSNFYNFFDGVDNKTTVLNQPGRWFEGDVTGKIEDDTICGSDECLCSEQCSLESVVVDTVFSVRDLLGDLEDVLTYHTRVREGTANGLVVPTISEAAATHLYSRIDQIHDSLAKSLEPR